MVAMAVINSYYSVVLGFLILLLSKSNSRNVGEVQSQPPSRNVSPSPAISTIRFISRSSSESGNVRRGFLASNSLTLKSQDQLLQAKESISEQCPPLPISSRPGLCQAMRCTDNEDCTKTSDISVERVCCFNGCVMTCMHKVDAPLAFDWVEETEFHIQHQTQTETAMNDSFPNQYTHQSSTSSSSSSSEDTTIDDDEYEDGEDLLTGRGATSVNHDGRLPPTMFTQNRQPPQAQRRLEPKTLMRSTSAAESVVLPGGCTLRPKQYQDLVQFRRNNHVKECLCVNGDVICEINPVNAAIPIPRL